MEQQNGRVCNDAYLLDAWPNCDTKAFGWSDSSVTALCYFIVSLGHHHMDMEEA